MSTKTTKRKRAAVVATAEASETSASPAVATHAVEAQPTVSLASNHTVKDAAVLKSRLLQVVHDSKPVAIDARSVERIDTAIIQLLCVFVRERAARDLRVSWLEPTRAFQEAVRLLGVQSMLALPDAVAGAGT